MKKQKTIKHQVDAVVSNIRTPIAGDLVETAVYVFGKRKPMAKGIVVAVRSGFCEVDIMSLHGGAPWIVYETTSHLRVINC